MLDLDGILKTLKKLDDRTEPGCVEFREGKKHSRYSYVLEETVVFSIGLTRGSSAKSMEFNYVPKQMGLNRKEYRDLHVCPMTKEQYNNKMFESGKV